MEKKKKPAIRFKGFTDSWEQRKLGDEAEEILAGGDIDKEKAVDDGVYPIYANALTNDGIVGYYDDYYRVKAPAVTVTGRGEVGHAQARIVDFTPVVRLLAIRSNHDCYFLENAINNHKVIVESTGVPQLTVPQLSSYDFCFPKDIMEEKKIGTYFNQLDHLITLHQRKYDKLQIIKKAMLEKMFPQNGSCFPEIRFKGFTDSWEQRKFDKWGDFYYGHSCPKWSVTEDATIPCIRYGELYTKFGAKIDKVYSYTNMPTEKLRFSKGTEVLIPRVGEDPMDYNHCTWLSLKDVAIGEMISVFNTDQDPLFSATMFNATLQKEFAIRVEGGSVTNLYFDKLRNIDISYPLLAEQKKIAAFFENLDHLITLHQREVEKLQNIKKSMLETMFV